MKRSRNFLAETAVILSENIDFDKRLANFAKLCIPFLADFGIVYISEKNKLIPKVCNHREKSWGEVLESLASGLFSKPEISPYKAGDITENLNPLHIENVSESFLQTVTPGDDEFKNFSSLDPKALLFVPLVARDRIIGVLVLAMSSSGRKFSDDDISFINIVKYRISLSIDNINLYHEAQQAIREREDILSIVSHDLRNPLSAIKSGFQLINTFATANEFEKLDKLVSTLTEASDFMERLINDLLDFSKIQQGVLPVKLQEASLKKLIEDVIQSVLAKAKEKSIDLLVNAPENDFKFVCDSHRIKQVLNNLIGNAIKFTPDKGKIILSVKEQDENFYFSVSDSGPGIPEKNIAHIFERFWQEKKTAHLGTGLGLFIAKGIVDAHMGTIWAESKIGQGADFQFKIPLNLKVES